MATRVKRGKRANGEGSIYQRADSGKWVAQVPAGFYANGKVRYKRYTLDTQKEARERLRAAQNELDRRGTVDTRKQTVAAFLTHWLEHTASAKLAAKTYESYAGEIRRNIIPAIGRLHLDRLGPQHVQQFLNDLRATGGKDRQGLSVRTV